ncbi:uncharacterized protein LOC132751388, partial [Ruditapes philippinarum]|uniref:uncharacterized protein LOC132751388 n=1 Tax=Ruditapes philippinarum TaxID=129788 RepID=UPI00295BA01E
MTSCENEDVASRDEFIEKWKAIIDGDMSSGTEESYQSSGDENCQVAGETLSCGTEDSFGSNSDQNFKGVNYGEAQECFLGTCDVHIENLVPPCASRATRLLDMDHVKSLSDSFQNGSNGQVAILVGMVPSDVTVDSLKEKGACKVETLGGNHTREAIQGLHRRGLFRETTVKVNVYVKMSTITALMLGWQHNMIIQEKQKSLTFMDKVRLMRQLLPSPPLSAGNIRQWKSQLATIFQIEDIRRLQASYSHHLQMAQLPEDVWGEAEKVAVSIAVSEKLFRNMMRLDKNDMIVDCLVCLRTEGRMSFNKKVKQYIDNGHTKTKKTKKNLQLE